MRAAIHQNKNVTIVRELRYLVLERITYFNLDTHGHIIVILGQIFNFYYIYQKLNQTSP